MKTSSADISAPYRAALVTNLEKHWYVTSNIREAFAHIPRHAFLESYYQRNQGSWTCISSPDAQDISDEDAFHRWFAAVYADRSLVTALDPHGTPTCSLSQPSLMAWMLYALDIHPQDHVLEVGTGQGYNAALMAFLNQRPEYVTTLDIDSAFVQAAKTRLQPLVSGIQASTGNGLYGFEPNAPYQKIILTASYHTIPCSLFHQLSPGGTLVMNLRGDLGGAFLTLNKHKDGTAHGTITDHPRMAFMRMCSMASEPPSSSPPQLTGREPLPHKIFSADLFNNHHFRFYAQWSFPHANYYWQSVQNKGQPSLQLRFVDPVTNSQLEWVPADSDDMSFVDIYGDQTLLQKLVDTYHSFSEAACPSPELYSVSIDQFGKSTLRLETNGQTWRLEE